MRLIQASAGDQWDTLEDNKKNMLRQQLWGKFAIYQADLSEEQPPNAPAAPKGSLKDSQASSAQPNVKELLKPAPSLREASGKGSKGSQELNKKSAAKDLADFEKASKKGKEADLEERMKSLWNVFDTDGNGILDLQEQEAFFGVVYDHIFKKGTLKIRKESREETMLHWRKFFDVNHDGVLSWIEFKVSRFLSCLLVTVKLTFTLL